MVDIVREVEFIDSLDELAELLNRHKFTFSEIVDVANIHYQHEYKDEVIVHYLRQFEGQEWEDLLVRLLDVEDGYLQARLIGMLDTDKTSQFERIFLENVKKFKFIALMECLEIIALYRDSLSSKAIEAGWNIISVCQEKDLDDFETDIFSKKLQYWNKHILA